MNDYIYIVAGNFPEYGDYVRRKIAETNTSHNSYKYVSGIDTIRGLKSIKGFYIGSYKSRDDILSIMLKIKIINKEAI
jgi:hypothetical protein